MTFDLTVTLPVIMSVATLAFAWYRTRSAAIEAVLKDFELRFAERGQIMQAHEQRIQRLEDAVKAMPAMTDLHRIDLSVERMVGSMKRMEAVLEGNQQIMQRLETIVSRHEDHLLSGAKR